MFVELVFFVELTLKGTQYQLILKKIELQCNWSRYLRLNNV